MARCLRTRAWTPAGTFARHSGFLELDDERIRFVTFHGTEVFHSRIEEAELRFPRRLPDGMIVAIARREYTVLFSDPYSEWSGGEARSARGQWKQAAGHVPFG